MSVMTSPQYAAPRRWYARQRSGDARSHWRRGSTGEGREQKGHLVDLHTMGISQATCMISSWELVNSLKDFDHGSWSIHLYIFIDLQPPDSCSVCKDCGDARSNRCGGGPGAGGEREGDHVRDGGRRGSAQAAAQLQDAVLQRAGEGRGGALSRAAEQRRSCVLKGFWALNVLFGSASGMRPAHSIANIIEYREKKARMFTVFVELGK
jgi:hypothetical protein